MGFETVNGVRQHYNERFVEDSLEGNTKVFGHETELTLTFTGSSYQDVSFVIPKGSKITTSILRVQEAFVLGGTAPSISIGDVVATHEILNLTQSNASTLGSYTGTTIGRFAVPLVADETVTVSLGGTSPTITSVGKAKLVIRYIRS